MRMHRGVYVGHHERTGAALMLTPQGLERGAGITRLPEADRYNDEILKTCRGLPWDAKQRRREAPGVVDAGVG